MEPPAQPLKQRFGNLEAADGGFAFQGNVYGDIHNHLHDNPPELFDSLPEAAYNAAGKRRSPFCLENTRCNILDQIEKWANGDDEKRIYWLKGMAGTGKSTIAMTVASKYDKLKRLGASFFFSRGGGNFASAGKFAITIAAQLADALPGLRERIRDAIASNRRIHGLGLYEQWEKLVLGPLSRLGKNVFLLPIVIVVDALDECDDEDDVSLLIQCLAAATAVETIRLRVFVTSRPEQPINSGSTASRRTCTEISSFTILNGPSYRLTHTAKRFGLSASIYSEEIIQCLVQKSDRLFIHAALVCRFIHEGGQLADERLALLVASGSAPTKPEKELDMMYTTILTYSFPVQLEPEEVAKLRDLFSLVVGSIVVLSDVMTPLDLVTILDKPKHDIFRMLHCLHSVLNVPEDETKPIRLLHPSFRDFLLDPARCLNKTFLVDANIVYRQLTNSCLWLMKNHIRRNIAKGPFGLD
ncbi:uncharacterized protein BCR38DRAFT_476669 [Pseudomassariella vexata]|uniref:Nephrocystin 3-like N-terminal domain-containing protein n=1 Tax=Pseudomassariella vexata TaxID=1141098 RepID=A0A1Y2DNK5_9PEZI|nr:uncharacterized protein BCR38DRAFT_476669 [Pseudomassariella vexata]ORY60787.1 hypothetical protein BCR38DRAFT_476669 [Pseudomassariella vexata]